MKRLAAVAAVGTLAFAAPASATRQPRPPTRHGQLPSGSSTVAVARATLPPVAGGGAVLTASTTRPDPADRSRERSDRADRGTGRRADGVWTALARCESGGNPRAVGGGGRYHGAFQFSIATWHSLGYQGDPLGYPFEVQLEAAKRLQARSGWAQWPACARRLGLR